MPTSQNIYLDIRIVANEIYGHGALSTTKATTSSTYDPVVIVDVEGFRYAVITGTVSGAGPLTGLMLTGSACPGGTHVPLLIDSDFSSATQSLRATLGLNSPTNIATGSKFQVVYDTLNCLSELGLFAKSANSATLVVEVGTSSTTAIQPVN